MYLRATQSKFCGGSRIQLISMATSQPVWCDGIVAASPQGFLGVHKLGAVPVISKNDTRRLFGNHLSESN